MYAADSEAEGPGANIIYKSTEILVVCVHMIHGTEGPLTMQVHGALLGGVSYAIMTQFMRQSADVALSRSMLLANLVAAYMLAFGHKLPSF